MRDVDGMAEDVSGLMARRLGLRGRTLEDKLSHSRRSLPGYVRDEAELIAEAKQMRGHPKLADRVDPRRIDHAFRVCRGHLNAIDRRARRRSAFLDWLTGLTFQFLLLGAAVLGVLSWRGLL